MFRAYVNGYYWIKNIYSDNESRNLGFYNPLQTDLSNYFRSLVIDWLNDSKNTKTIIENLEEYLDIRKSSKNAVKDFILKLSKDAAIMSNCVIELHILSKLNNMPIIVYNNYNNIIYIFKDGLVYDSKKHNKIPDLYTKLTTTENNNAINLRFSFRTNNKIPEEIETIYFKDSKE